MFIIHFFLCIVLFNSILFVLLIINSICFVIPFITVFSFRRNAHSVAHNVAFVVTSGQ